MNSHSYSFKGKVILFILFLSYFLFSEILKELFDIDSEDLPEAMAEKLVSHLPVLTAADPDVLSDEAKEAIVFLGLVMAWRFAGAPTFFSPFSKKATIEGVVLAPSLLAITTGSFPSITATQELVVPKSIPIIFPMLYK